MFFLIGRRRSGKKLSPPGNFCPPQGGLSVAALFFLDTQFHTPYTQPTKKRLLTKNSGNGFLFETFDPNGLFWATEQAMLFYKRPRKVREKQIKRIMTQMQPPSIILSRLLSTSISAKRCCSALSLLPTCHVERSNIRQKPTKLETRARSGS